MNWPLLSRTMTSVETISKLRRMTPPCGTLGAMTGLSGVGCCVVAGGAWRRCVLRLKRSAGSKKRRGRRHFQRPLKINCSHGLIIRLLVFSGVPGGLVGLRLGDRPDRHPPPAARNPRAGDRLSAGGGDGDQPPIEAIQKRSRTIRGRRLLQLRSPTCRGLDARPGFSALPDEPDRGPSRKFAPGLRSIGREVRENPSEPSAVFHGANASPGCGRGWRRFDARLQPESLR